MKLLNKLRNTKTLINSRMLSTKKSMIDISFNKNGVALVTMNRLPVNSINLDFAKDISNTLDSLDRDGIRAMILTSASPTVFSAGLDLTELYKPDLERLKHFNAAIGDVWAKLFGSRFITAAAINGHSPAAGCLLAMCCEYRVMVDGNSKDTFKIGLNEAQFGLTISPIFMETMLYTIHRKLAERAMLDGTMFTAQDALEVQLIDEIAINKEDAIEKCEQFIKRFDKTDFTARAITKLSMRGPLIKKIQENSATDFKVSTDFITLPETQEKLGVYINKLRKSKNK